MCDKNSWGPCQKPQQEDDYEEYPEYENPNGFMFEADICLSWTFFGHFLFQFLCNLQQYCDNAYNKLNSLQQKEFIDITKNELYLDKKKEEREGDKHTCTHACTNTRTHARAPTHLPTHTHTIPN